MVGRGELTIQQNAKIIHTVDNCTVVLGRFRKCAVMHDFTKKTSVSQGAYDTCKLKKCVIFHILNSIFLFFFKQCGTYKNRSALTLEWTEYPASNMPVPISLS